MDDYKFEISEIGETFTSNIEMRSGDYSLRLTKEGFEHKGEIIKDAGKAHSEFLSFLGYANSPKDARIAKLEKALQDISELETRTTWITTAVEMAKKALEE